MLLMSSAFCVYWPKCSGGLQRHRSLEMWYLHGPDRSVPYEETLKTVNELYKEGYFKRFGISNYAAYVPSSMYGLEQSLNNIHQIDGKSLKQSVSAKQTAIFCPPHTRGSTMRSTAVQNQNCSHASENLGLVSMNLIPVSVGDIIEAFRQFTPLFSGRRIFHWPLFVQRRCSGRGFSV